MASSAVMLSTSERNNMGRERLLSCLSECGAEHEPVVLLELQKTYFNKYDEYLNKAELRKFFSKGHIKQVFENFMPKDVEMATDVNATGSLFIKMKRPLRYALADTPKSAPLMVPKTSNTEGVRSTLVPLPPPPPAPPVEQPTAPPAPSRSKTAVTTADKFKVPSSVVPGHRLLPSNQKESFSFAAGGFGGAACNNNNGTNGGTSAAAQSSSADDLFDDFVPRDGTAGGGAGTRNNSETSTLVAYEGEEDIGGKAEPTATRKPSLTTTTGRQMTTMKPKRSFWDYDGDLDDDEGIGAGDNGGEQDKTATGKAPATAANNRGGGSDYNDNRDDANARRRHCRYRRDDITAVVDNNKNHDDEDEEDNSSWGGDLLGDSALEDGYQQMKRQQQQQQQAAAAAAVVAAAVALNSNNSDRAAVTASTGRGGERSNNNTAGGGGFGNAPSAMRRVRVGLMGNTNGNNGVGGDAGKKHGGDGNNRNGGDNDHDEEDGDGIKNNNAIDRTVGSLLEAKWAEERQARDALVAERLRNRKQRDETATAPAAGAALFTLNSSNNNSKKVNNSNNNNDAAWCDDDEDVEESGRVVAKRNVGEGMKQRFGQQQGKYNNNSGSFSNKVTKPNLYGGNARFRDVPPPPFAPNLMSSDDDEEEEEEEAELVKQYMTDKREKKPSAQPQQQQHEDGAVQQQKGKGTNAKMAFDDEEEEYDEEEEEEGPMMMMTQKKEGEEDNDGELDDGAHHHDTTSPEELQDEETEQFYQQFAGSTTSSKLAAKSKKFSEDERNKYVGQFSVVMGMLQNVNHIEFDKTLARLSTNGDYRKAFPSAADLLAFITVNCPNIKAIKVSKQDVALLWSERSDELVSLLLQHVGKVILKKSVGKAYDY